MNLAKYIVLLIISVLAWVASLVFYYASSQAQITLLHKDIATLKNNQEIIIKTSAHLSNIEFLMLKMIVLPYTHTLVNDTKYSIKSLLQKSQKLLDSQNDNSLQEISNSLNIKAINFNKKLLSKMNSFQDQLEYGSALVEEKYYILSGDKSKIGPTRKKIGEFTKALSLYSDKDSSEILSQLEAHITDKEKVINKYLNQHNMLDITVFFMSIIAVIVFMIIRQIVQVNKKLEYNLYYDTLTKIQNRTSLEKEIESKKSLFLINISSFSSINELYGIKTGDKVLRGFASLLFKCIKNRDGMEVFRFSGDIFAISSVKKIDSKRFIKEIKTCISNHALQVNNIEFNINTRISASSGKSLIEHASIALSYCKSQNLKQSVYTPEIKNIEGIEESIMWQKRIKLGLEKERFTPFFHAIVDREGKIIKYESLVRLLDEDGRYVPPVFLEVAIKNMQYIDISKMTIEKSFEAFKESGHLSININYLDIENERATKFLTLLLKKFPGIAKRATFEVLENFAIKDYILLKEFIDKFRKLGVKIAIDDFGSGYSNYSKISEISPDILKIDGSLIRNIETDKSAYALVKSIVTYAKKLDIEVVAEYVHSKEVFETCKDLEIDYFQGYYFYKPQKDRVE